MHLLQVSLPASRYPEPSARLAFYRKALDALAELPGVQSAAAFSTFPMSNNGVFYGYLQVEGRPETDLRHSPWAEMHSVSPEYLRLMRIPLVTGRRFTSDDREDAQRVAIVSQKLAQLHWPNESVIGKRIRSGTPGETGPWLTVVGIAGDVLYDWTSHIPQAALYLPLTQAPPAASLLGIRVGADPNSYAAAARARIAAIDPELPPFDLKPLSDAIDESTVGLGYTSAMMGILASIAFAISVVGLYALMTYTVGERVHEFGVRIALGAQRRDVLWLVSRYGLLLVAAGLAIGLPSAVVSARLLASFVYGTGPLDSATFVGVPAALLVAVLAACYIPARRATRVDPVTTLRHG